jgi:hypothetical protein
LAPGRLEWPASELLWELVQPRLVVLPASAAQRVEEAAVAAEEAPAAERV